MTRLLLLLLCLACTSTGLRAQESDLPSFGEGNANCRDVQATAIEHLHSRLEAPALDAADPRLEGAGHLLAGGSAALIAR